MLCAEGYEVAVCARGDEGSDERGANFTTLRRTYLAVAGPWVGLELAGDCMWLKPKQPIISMTAHGTTETAIEVTKLGACDYLLKPFEADELLDMVATSVASCPSRGDGEGEPDGPALCKSRAMQAIYKEISGRVAATPATVLIRGGTGTGRNSLCGPSISTASGG